MPTIQVKISNLSQIKRAFARSPSLMTKELNTAIRRTVIEIGRGSRLNTPVDTGRLRASTYERFGNLRGEIGTNTEYDTFVHEGTRYMKARPYLKNAVNSNSSNTDANFKDAAQRVLDRIGADTK